ncbi:MAG: tyrosine-type recombinase/integrase [Kiritimatiellae bacterium]|nr:tyrosine-type recombinase/integrase [Kiritimatiellia bacterium]
MTNRRLTKHRTGHLYKRDKLGNEIPADDPRHGTYYLQYRVNGKKVRQSLKTTERDVAERKRLEIMSPYLVADEKQVLATAVHRLDVASHNQEEALRRNGSVTVANAWQHFLDAPNRPDTGDATLHIYGLQYGRFAKWMESRYPDQAMLSDVSTSIGNEYAGSLKKSGLAPGTFNKHIRLLMLVFKVLKREAQVESNPWEDITRLKDNPQSRRELTSEELSEIVRAATGELHSLFALGIYTGLRLGDCATLRWSEVDLARRLIMRVPSKTARSKGTTVHIPIHPDLGRILAQVRDEQSGRAVAGARKHSNRTTGTNTPEYVLPQTATDYVRRTDAVTDGIQKHFINCGIQIHKDGTGKVQLKRKGCKYRSKGKRAVVEVGFHSLRHTFVSLCREANAPLAVVEAIVGHSNPAMTRHYTHVGEIAAQQAVAALPSITGHFQHVKATVSVPDFNGDVLAALKAMNAENWQAIRDQLVDSLH